MLENSTSVLEAQSNILNTTVDLGPKDANPNCTFVCEEPSVSAVNDTTTVLNATFDTISTTAVESDTIVDKAIDCTVVGDQPIGTADINSADDLPINSASSEPTSEVVADIVVVDSSSAEIITVSEEQTPTAPAEPVTTESADKIEPAGDINDTVSAQEIDIADKPLAVEKERLNTVTSTPDTSKMADEEEVPLPRGAYTINWDEIDEFADPFAMSKPKGLYIAS